MNTCKARKKMRARKARKVRKKIKAGKALKTIKVRKARKKWSHVRYLKNEGMYKAKVRRHTGT